MSCSRELTVTTIFSCHSIQYHSACTVNNLSVYFHRCRMSNLEWQLITCLVSTAWEGTCSSHVTEHWQQVPEHWLLLPVQNSWEANPLPIDKPSLGEHPQIDMPCASTSAYQLVVCSLCFSSSEGRTNGSLQRCHWPFHIHFSKPS